MSGPVPLHDPAHDIPPGVLHVKVTLQLAREALAKHENADVRDQTAMFFAAGDLEHALRNLVVALDYTQGT
jgi:hypothetical protein